MAITPAPLPTLYTVNDAAQQLGIPLNTMRKLAYTRQLPTLKIGGRVYITHDALTAWLAHASQPAAEG